MHSLVKYLSNRAFHFGESTSMGAKTPGEDISEHPLSLSVKYLAVAQADGGESNRGFIGSLRNWLKYVSVSLGNSPRQGSAFRKFQPLAFRSILIVPLAFLFALSRNMHGTPRPRKPSSLLFLSIDRQSYWKSNYLSFFRTI